MNRDVRWFAVSPQDHRVHLVIPGAGLARCGHRMPTDVQPYDTPPQDAPPCAPCSRIFLAEFHT